MKRISELQHDQRGAVMVIGVFMAAFLVGVLWYVIGIGDAAIYRELMQDGADATAFAAAVYQARGMNIIALMNLIMAAVLAVLVALKVAQVLLTIAGIIICVVTIFLGCGAVAEAEIALQNFISKVEPIVDKTLKVLYVAESAVAVGMPWIAEAKAVVVARDYKPTVKGGFMVGISLIPGHLTKYLGELGSGGGEGESTPEDPRHILCKDGRRSPTCKCIRTSYQGCCSYHGGGVRSTDGITKYQCEKPHPENKNAGIRWGLPVEDDEFSVLCAKAGKNIVDIVFFPLGSWADSVKEHAESFMEGLVVTFQQYFCGDGGFDIKGGASKFAEGLCNDGGPAKDDIDKHNENIPEDSKEEKVKINKDDCMDRFNKAADKLNLPAGKDVGYKVPKRVYGEATAGDNYFASWSFVWGELKSQSSAQKGVDVAAWKQVTTSDPSFFSNYHFARSEFYYEPKLSDSDRTWEGLGEDSMWNMRWRARLRRTYMPPMKLSSMFSEQVDNIANKIGDKLDNKEMGHVAVDQMMKLLGDPVGQLESVDNQLGEKLGNANEGIIH